MNLHLSQSDSAREKGRGLVALGREPIASLIDINELSRRLSIAKGTLYNWVYLRRIPCVKAGRCLRFDYDAVFRALRQTTMGEAGRR